MDTSSPGTPGPSYPSMTPSGWMPGLGPIGKEILKNYFKTNASQSTMYETYSLAYDIQVSSGDPGQLEELVGSSLGQLFRQYFSLVDAKVTVQPLEEDDSILNIKVDLTYGRDGVKTNLVYSVQGTATDFRSFHGEYV